MKKNKNSLNKEPAQETKKIEEQETSEKTEDKKDEKPKQPVQKKPKIKKTETMVLGKNLRISTKYSAAICRFIKNKKIEKAIKELEEVLGKKRPIPMKGEYPHRKGKGKIASGGGRYPKKATENFIMLLKSLQANANYNEINEPVIFEAFSNIGERPYGRFGAVRRKRTHLIIKAKEKKMINKINKEKRK